MKRWNTEEVRQTCQARVLSGVLKDMSVMDLTIVGYSCLQDFPFRAWKFIGVKGAQTNLGQIISWTVKTVIPLERSCLNGCRLFGYLVGVGTNQYGTRNESLGKNLGLICCTEHWHDWYGYKCWWYSGKGMIVSLISAISLPFLSRYTTLEAMCVSTPFSLSWKVSPLTGTAYSSAFQPLTISTDGKGISLSLGKALWGIVGGCFSLRQALKGRARAWSKFAHRQLSTELHWEVGSRFWISLRLPVLRRLPVSMFSNRVEWCSKCRQVLAFRQRRREW